MKAKELKEDRPYKAIDKDGKKYDAIKANGTYLYA